MQISFVIVISYLINCQKGLIRKDILLKGLNVKFICNVYVYSLVYVFFMRFQGVLRLYCKIIYDQ